MQRELVPVFGGLEQQTLALLDQRFPQRFPDRAKEELSADDLAWIEQISGYVTGNLARDLEADGSIKRRVEEALKVRTDAVLGQLLGAFDQDVYSRVVAEYARKHAYDRGVLVQISATTKELLGSALEDAIARGLPYDVVREEIADFFGDLKEWETYRIAATEVANASRYGNLLATQQAVDEYGIEIDRAYLSTATDACAQVCLPMAALTRSQVVSVAEAGTLSGQLHPHCRCDWIYEIADAEKALRLMLRRALCRA
ncbi:MAG: hypothetical protein IT345_08100 [Trueperaceae bacterium]|nr:hypothetical protein [Trueperaceae bacterium]